MISILIPVCIVSGVGAVFGVILSVAAVLLEVPVDKKQEAIREALPGANCGACGYPGCDGYAEALAQGSVTAMLCAPGGQAVRTKLAEILDLDVGSFKQVSAFVQCAGSYYNTSNKMRYVGESSCAYANQIFAGPWSCPYGCLGYGDCMAVCEYDAIQVMDGVAVVDAEKCVACAKCVAACPKSIIAIAPTDHTARMACSSKDRGAQVKQLCTAGCIGCTKCVKSCPEGAIHMVGALARVDYEKCTGCGTCTQSCPQNCFEIS